VVSDVSVRAEPLSAALKDLGRKRFRIGDVDPDRECEQEKSGG
jgi:hypothetical protein